MKLNRSLLRLALAVTITGIAVTVIAKSIVPKPTAAQIAGVYSGYGSYTEFLRLELDADGTGLLCVNTLPEYPAKLYRVEGWRVSDWTVHLKTRPIDSGAETITFHKVTYSYRSLDGEFGGSRWKRAFKLYNERRWQSRALQVQERIAKYRNENK